jgi:hypothetical protein
MLGQGLKGVHARPGTLDPRDERPWEGMEVESSLRGLVGDSDGFEIPPDHLCRLVVERQHRPAGWLANQPRAKVVRE